MPLLGRAPVAFRARAWTPEPTDFRGSMAGDPTMGRGRCPYCQSALTRFGSGCPNAKCPGRPKPHDSDPVEQKLCTGILKAKVAMDCVFNFKRCQTQADAEAALAHAIQRTFAFGEFRTRLRYDDLLIDVQGFEPD